VAGVAAILFEGDVLHRAPALHDGDGSLVVGQHHLDQPKVHQLDVAGGRDLDVAGLDVAVEHGRVLAVHVVQGVAQLRGPAQDLSLGQGMALAHGRGQQLFQVLAGHKVHDQVIPVLEGKVIRDLGQVGMVQAGQGAGLLVELLARLAQLFGSGVGIGQRFLDGADAPLEAQVIGAIRGTHATAPDELDDSVAFA